MASRSLCAYSALLTTILFAQTAAFGQDQSAKDPSPPAEENQPAQDSQPEGASSALQGKPPVEIAEEPRTIDPARFLPDELAKNVTVEFEEATLRDGFSWLKENLSMPVLIDEVALRDAGLSQGELYSEVLQDEPVYFLLNRLKMRIPVPLAWYVEDGIVHITTAEGADRLVTETYVVTDLLDMGHSYDTLIQTVQDQTEGPWLNVDGTGGNLEALGDVLFIRQSHGVHRQVQGLFAALKEHGRETFTTDPPENLRLRELLHKNLSVEFKDVRLDRAIEEIGTKAGAKIGLDHVRISDAGVRGRELVSLSLADMEFSTVLKALIGPLGLTWVIQDGMIWITSAEHADEILKTVVYDVRDLCRDSSESDALISAIQSQTAGPWFDVDGIGGTIACPVVGTMVVRQTERELAEVRVLLATYRDTLMHSRPRAEVETIDPNEVLTRYYRLDAVLAESLLTLLPDIVDPQSWQAPGRPDGGTIRLVNAGKELVGAAGPAIASDENKAPGNALIVERATLIIRQTRVNHAKIGKVISDVQVGDPLWTTEAEALGKGPPDGMGGMMGGGIGGMGGSEGMGFGGGYFAVPSQSDGSR